MPARAINRIASLEDYAYCAVRGLDLRSGRVTVIPLLTVVTGANSTPTARRTQLIVSLGACLPCYYASASRKVIDRFGWQSRHDH
jgi:hypothetical protein